MLLRLTIPTLAGTSFSLALLYLQHKAQTTHQHEMTESFVQSSESLKLLKSKRDHALGVGGSGDDKDQGEQGQGLTRSRFQPRRHASLSEEVRQKWNTHLTSFTSTLSTLNPDDIVLSSLATLSYWSQKLFSSVSNSASTANGSSSSTTQLLGDKQTMYAQDARHSLSLRSAEERAALAKEQTGLDGSQLGVRI